MKATCRYTGLELISSSGFARWSVISEHPIFAVPLEDVLTMAATEWSPEMFILDKKLLYLAIAKNCELITWENTREFAPAVPSPSTVESGIAPLMQIAGWIDFQRSVNKHADYPALRITPETADMTSFRDMLQEIISHRDVTAKQERREHRLICLESNARILSARCRIGANKEAALLNTTAEWAIMVTEQALNEERIPEEIRNDWKRMLTTPANLIKAKGFSIADVEEMREFFIDNLPHGSIIAHDVIAHLNRLVEVNSFSDIDGGTILSARMLTAGTLVASATEPVRSEFASIVEYARAKAAYILVQTQKLETQKDLDAANKAAIIARMRDKDVSDDI